MRREANTYWTCGTHVLCDELRRETEDLQSGNVDVCWVWTSIADGRVLHRVSAVAVAIGESAR